MSYQGHFHLPYQNKAQIRGETMRLLHTLLLLLISSSVIAEPMRWTTVELPPPGYWARVREICDRHGVLL